jgi:hypothetical protein
MDEEDCLTIRTVGEFITWIDSVNVNRQGTAQSNEYRSRTELFRLG